MKHNQSDNSHYAQFSFGITEKRDSDKLELRKKKYESLSQKNGERETKTNQTSRKRKENKK